MKRRLSWFLVLLIAGLQACSNTHLFDDIVFETTDPTTADCYDGNFRIANQIDCDEFRQYECIQGNLNIHSIDLEECNLPNLTDIYGSLIVGDETQLSYFQQMVLYDHFEPVIFYRDNDALQNLNGLSNLSSISGELVVSHNSSLVSIEGLGNLDRVNGPIRIRLNPVLTSLEGLHNLKEARAQVAIENNDALINLEGLRSLSSVAEYFRVTFNASLAIDGLRHLSNLESVGHSLIIYGNGGLQTLEGLDNVVSAAEIAIYKNTSLTSLRNLSSLTHVYGMIQIVDNIELPQCEACVLLDQLETLAGPYKVQGPDYSDCSACL